MDVHEIEFSGSVLRRGFWIYVWRVEVSDDRVFVYIGRTGDSSSPNAQSPFNRVGQHVDPNPNSKSNALTRNLRARGIEPELCKFKFIAIGPIMDEADSMESHIPLRNAIAGLERRVADWFTERGYQVLGTHPRPRDFDPAVWRTIENELTTRFPANDIAPTSPQTCHTDDSDEIAKLFRDNDDLGSDSSLWLRVIRQLLVSGKPIGQLTVLAFRGSNTGAYPFGALTHTENQRVVFWPVLPRNADMIAANGKIGVADHFTLELTNKKTHVTAYDAAGKPSRTSAADLGHKQAWRIHDVGDSGLALWFTMLVRWSALLDQETAVQRCVQAPTPAEADRRKRLFNEIAAKMRVIDIPLPKSTSNPEYVCCAAYLVTGHDGEFNLSADVFPYGQFETEVDGWPAESVIETQPYQLTHENTKFVFATACPPGKMQEDVTFGLPRLDMSK